ncbi:protein FAM204A isoform 2-T2 [Pholidichthys leucotaenia]
MMYSGLLPKGITEDDLSPEEEEEDEGEKPENATGSPVQQQLTNTGSDADSPTCSLSGISQEMWQKFQNLRKKKEEIKTLKIPEKRKRRKRKKGASTKEPTETRERQEEREKHWDELKQYFGVNDRFDPPACSKPPPKSGLEKSIEGAIAEGDIAKAEEMSDRLATREARRKQTTPIADLTLAMVNMHDEEMRLLERQHDQRQESGVHAAFATGGRRCAGRCA